MKQYKGSCHCGAVEFSFNRDQEISSGVRCNCSLCRRKGAVMSDFTIAPDEFKINAEDGALSMYQFAKKIAKHYFCNTCGIYPFHETLKKPGHYRVNLGCIDEIDANAIHVELFDGKSI